MDVERIPISHIRPAAYNPRKDLKPGDPEYEKIRRSIERWDLVEPLVWNRRTGNLVGGHQRLKVIEARGDTEVEVSVVDLDEQDEAALNIALNKAQGDWELPKLAELLSELQGKNYDVSLTGFDAKEFEEILAWKPDRDGAPEEGDVDLTQAPEPKSRRGEVYELGPHRVMCGDATNAEDVSALMQGERAEVLWTDPPYGVNYVGKTKDALTIQNDGRESLSALLEAAFGCADAIMAEGARFYIAAPAGSNGTDFRLALQRVGWLFHQALVWVKDVFVLGHSDYHYQHEDVLYGWKPGAGRPGRGSHDGSRWYGGNDQSTTFHVPRPKQSEEHPTMKPPELIEMQLRNSARRGDVIVDLFGGSGSTLIACERLGLRGRMLELAPGYVDVIRRRYARFVGRPELEP